LLRKALFQIIANKRAPAASTGDSHDSYSRNWASNDGYESILEKASNS